MISTARPYLERIVAVAAWAVCSLAQAAPVAAHLTGSSSHDGGRAHYDFAVRPPTYVWAVQPGSAARVSAPRLASAPLGTPLILPLPGDPAEILSGIFRPFSPTVKTRSDENYLYVESNSMPAHRMMVGITAWQQQVPLPQPYVGQNAWRLPLRPVVAQHPLSAKSHFFRGAIALAANGVPIFNPIKNDGRTDTFLAGELDEFGGHCGRADDYHYHIAPTHLQDAVGDGKPLAVALDGYLIYGYTEPNGSAIGKLDEFNGHTTSALGYHYHATRNYPYLNGGFHGEVVEREGQVDPQPQAHGVRPALPPLRGAKITGFTSQENRRFDVEFQMRDLTYHVKYALNPDGTIRFDYVGSGGQVRTETYSSRRRGGDRPSDGDRPRGGGRRPDSPRGEADRPSNGDRPRGGGRRPDSPRGEAGGAGGSERQSPPDAGNRPLILNAKRTGKFTLTSSAVRDGDPLPIEFTGDGAGLTLPLEWSGVPAGTRSFAIVMNHLAPDNLMKSYWVMWDIPAGLTRLPKAVQGVGKVGATSQRGRSYVPPRSQGPGKKVYTIHIYALSDLPRLDGPPTEVTREKLLTALNDLILDSADLRVTYTKPER